MYVREIQPIVYSHAHAVTHIGESYRDYDGQSILIAPCHTHCKLLTGICRHLRYEEAGWLYTIFRGFL